MAEAATITATTSANDAAVELDGVDVAFRLADGGVYQAVQSATLTVADGEFVSIVGPTGCGKSTLLNIAAGLIAPAAGSATIFGAPLTDLNFKAGYLFQADALFPWKTALENVAIGLEVAGTPYDRYPGFVLVVSPKHTASIKSIKDLANKKVGVSAPGSSTDFFLKYILSKNGVDPNSVAVIGVGLGATAVASMEQGEIEAAIMLDPAVTLLAGKYQDLKILSDTRSQKDTLAVFGGEYPGGALYTKADWIASHEKEVQGMTNAIMATLKWIRTHTPEEIADKMPPELVGKDRALYIAALKNTLPMFSETGLMDPKGAEAVLAVFSQSVPSIRDAKIDLSKTYTNKYVEAGGKTN